MSDTLITLTAFVLVIISAVVTLIITRFIQIIIDVTKEMKTGGGGFRE